MTKLQMKELLKLSLKDKLKVVQTLWDDIADEQSIDSISKEHKKIIDERLQMINSDNVKLKTWSEIQVKFYKG